MSTTREYKDGGQSAPQWKPAVVWGANHAHGPEAAYDDDDTEAYNLHGSPEKGKCMYAVGRSVGLPRKGQVKLGDISGQVTMYSDLIVMAQRWNLLCHWATAHKWLSSSVCGSYFDGAISGVGTTAEELWKEKCGKIITVLAGHMNSKDCRKQATVAWKHAAHLYVQFMVSVTFRWATGQPVDLAPAFTTAECLPRPFSSTVPL